MKNVLLVHGDRTLLQPVAGILKYQGAFFRLHTAANTEKALEFVGQTPVDLVITALRFPQLANFQFFDTLINTGEDLRIILVVKGILPLTRAKLKKYPAISLYDISADQGLLIKRIFTELHIDYGGCIRGIALSSFLQMLALENCSCTLSISCKNLVGYLWLKNGELIAAQSANREGKEAALEIAAWKNVSVHIDYSPFDKARQFSISFMMLFLESGQQVDEIAWSKKDRRVHDRYELHVTTDYVFKDQTRQATLHDISLGGAYLEIDQNIGLGEKIRLHLSAPNVPEDCYVESRIIRKDGKGAGVRFNLDSNLQQQIIRSMIESSKYSSRKKELEGLRPPA